MEEREEVKAAEGMVVEVTVAARARMARVVVTEVEAMEEATESEWRVAARVAAA